ncbi:MAG: NAD-dependent epimerase/dehydratase family protein, partial [Patescibacteria group bacterium]
MSKLVVTGGAGFIGSHVTDRLIELGHQVVVIDNLMIGKKSFVNKKAKFVKADIRDFNKIKKYFVGAEAIFHLAADPRLPISIEDPIATHEINVTGTINVLEAARKAGVKKVVFSSSCAVYGDTT